MSTNHDIFDDLANTNWDDVDTSMPVLRPGIYEFLVKNMERKQNKTNDGSHLLIELALNQEAEDVTGERTINVGYPVYDRISLVETENNDPRRRIKLFLESVGMADQPFDATFQAYVNQTLLGETNIERDKSGTYPDRPGLRKYIKAGTDVPTSGSSI